MPAGNGSDGHNAAPGFLISVIAPTFYGINPVVHQFKKYFAHFLTGTTLEKVMRRSKNVLLSVALQILPFCVLVF